MNTEKNRPDILMVSIDDKKRKSNFTQFQQIQSDSNPDEKCDNIGHEVNNSNDDESTKLFCADSHPLHQNINEFHTLYSAVEDNNKESILRYA